MVTARLGRIAVIPLIVAIAGFASSARCNDLEPWPVKNKLLGKDGGKSKDVSGIACTTATRFPRTCLVIDDNLQDAQVVTLMDGRLVAGSTVKLIDDQFANQPLELDGEGIAFADGRYYVIGSHGHPRDKKNKLDPTINAAEIAARISASSKIIRVGTTGDTANASKIARSSRLREIIRAEPALVPFMDRRLENNGLTIEGVAIRDGNTLLAGLRGPVLGNYDRAVVVAAPLDVLFGGSGVDHQTFLLPLGEGRGVRDLTAYENVFLVLAGPVADGPGAYAVYLWDGKSESVRLLTELSSFDRERKPEGLLVLDKTSRRLRVLVMFDGDKEGAPTAIEIPAP